MVITMKKIPIALTTVEHVKSFVNDIIAVEYPMDVSSERYIVNAKSILGLFSLDLAKPLELIVHAGEDEDSGLTSGAAYQGDFFGCLPIITGKTPMI